MSQIALSGILLKNQRSAPRILQIIRCYSSKINFDELVKKNKVVVFMKGDPKFPRCGFSNAVTQIFRMHKVDYDAHDVLQDEELREGIKAYSSWPTIPQVFIDGKFVGGCDILLKMHQNGTLIEELQKVGIKSALLEKAMEEKKQEQSEKHLSSTEDENKKYSIRLNETKNEKVKV